MIWRDLYWKKISPFLNKPVVKVLTGMRRVGKSYFLREIIGRLAEQGVSESNILFIDKEDLQFDNIRSYAELHNYVTSKMAKVKGQKYLLVDEIQEIEEWERCVASCLKKEDFDIFITGSNAHLLSSELATLISGRYIEFTIYPLSFSEYQIFRGDQFADRTVEFERYLRYGGLPGLFHLELSDETVFQYLNAIYNTILLKDIVKRYSVRSVGLLESFARYFFDNIGQLMASNNITNFLKSQNIRTYPDTIQNFLSYFTATFLGHSAKRYDIKGKRLFEINDKYFANDLGIRHSVTGYRGGDIGQLLENVVYIELLRRGFSVCVGLQGQREIDFIAMRQGTKLYIQVAYLLESAMTVEREFRPLLEVKDNYPKLVLSMDQKIWGAEYEGVKRMNIVDFLMDADGDSE
ncbi:MAG: ATP-binding protein [Kiritimatiellae bacterium]|nr:ATP-binding protein [Kiritimatiellia bacterium]